MCLLGGDVAAAKEFFARRVAWERNREMPCWEVQSLKEGPPKIDPPEIGHGGSMSIVYISNLGPIRSSQFACYSSKGKTQNQERPTFCLLAK